MTCRRSLCVLLFFSLTALMACERLTLPPRPDGIPQGSILERRTRLWILQTPEREVAYYSDGKMAYNVEKEKGVRHGSWNSFSPEKTEVITSGQYRNGRRDGRWFHSDDAGQPYAQISYADSPVDPVISAISSEAGNENGPFERFYPDGTVELTGSYQAGRFHGLFRRLTRRGSLEYEGWYRDGEKDGHWKYFDSTGRLQREEWYRHGRLDGPLRLFEEGKLHFETVYGDGNETGPRRWNAPPEQ